VATGVPAELVLAQLRHYEPDSLLTEVRAEL
jgi:hypothetical protein